VTLNQQSPVTGVDHGLLVNGLVVNFLGTTYIVSSAESDIGNCPGELSAARRAAARRAAARHATARHHRSARRHGSARRHRARGRGR
jgi:hypothetical protein